MSRLFVDGVVAGRVEALAITSLYSVFVELLVSLGVAFVGVVSIAIILNYLTRRAQNEADEMNEEFRRLSAKTGRVYPKIYVD